MKKEHKMLITAKIDSTFRNTTKNRIAKQCLEHASEWTILYKDMDLRAKWKRSYLENYNSCHQYIIDNFDKSQVKTFSILAIILPTIISYIAKWVTQWVLDNLLDD
jgi:hypothetical protein